MREAECGTDRAGVNMAELMSGRAPDVALFRRAGLSEHHSAGGKTIYSFCTGALKPEPVQPGLWMLSDGAQPQLGDRLSQAAAFLSKRLECPAPNMLVDARGAGPAFSFCEHLAPGAAYIRFATSEPGEAVISHEMAHAFLRSTNRLLDEGFAEWASLGVAGDVRPVDFDTLHRAISDTRAWDLGFETVARTPDARVRLRQTATRLIAALIGRGGVAGLKRCFADVSCAAQSDHAGLIEASLGTVLCEWLAGEVGRLTEVGKHRAENLRARLDGDFQRLAVMASDVFARGGQTPDAHLIDIALTGFASELRERLRAGGEISGDDIKRFDQWVDKAAELGLPVGRRRVLSAHRLMLAACMGERAGVTARAAAEAMQAETLLRARLEDAPGDLDAHLLLARLLVHKPARFGGGPGAAMEHFGRVSAAFSTPLEGTALRLCGVTAARGEFCLQIDRLGVDRGEHVGLIGGNGSGKSSLVDLCLGLLDFQGEAELLGAPVSRMGRSGEQRARIGALIGQASLPGALTVGEVVELVDTVYGRRDGHVAEVLGLDEIRTRRLGHLSMGQRRRAELYCALGHQPELVFLDEPSHGLDAVFAKGLRELLFGLWGRGRTIIVASHIAEDIAGVDRLIGLTEGRVSSEGSPASLIAALGWMWRVEIEPGYEAGLGEALGRLDHIVRLETSETGVLIAKGREGFAQSFAALASSRDIATYLVTRADINSLMTETSQT